MCSISFCSGGGAFGGGGGGAFGGGGGGGGGESGGGCGGSGLSNFSLPISISLTMTKTPGKIPAYPPLKTHSTSTFLFQFHIKIPRVHQGTPVLYHNEV